MHSIRLRGPWQFEIRDDCKTSRTGTIKLPVDLVTLFSNSEQSDSSTELIVTRNFNRPTGITSSDSIWLCVAGLETEISANLNETGLESMARAKRSMANEEGNRLFDITSILKPTNKLAITIHNPVTTSKLSMEVQLQIGSTHK